MIELNISYICSNVVEKMSKIIRLFFGIEVFLAYLSTITWYFLNSRLGMLNETGKDMILGLAWVNVVFLFLSILSMVIIMMPRKNLTFPHILIALIILTPFLFQLNELFFHDIINLEGMLILFIGSTFLPVGISMLDKLILKLSHEADNSIEINQMNLYLHYQRGIYAIWIFFNHQFGFFILGLNRNWFYTSVFQVLIGSPIILIMVILLIGWNIGLIFSYIIKLPPIKALHFGYKIVFLIIIGVLEIFYWRVMTFGDGIGSRPLLLLFNVFISAVLFLLHVLFDIKARRSEKELSDLYEDALVDRMIKKSRNPSSSFSSLSNQEGKKDHNFIVCQSCNQPIEIQQLNEIINNKQVFCQYCGKSLELYQAEGHKINSLLTTHETVINQLENLNKTESKPISKFPGHLDYQDNSDMSSR